MNSGIFIDNLSSTLMTVLVSNQFCSRSYFLGYCMAILTLSVASPCAFALE